jgi:hypothetical protein
VLDAAEIRAFLEIIHSHAAHVTAGMDQPGLMTLVRVHPDAKGAISQRFLIGDVDTMAQVAADDAAAGFNCCVEPRTVRPGLRGNERGTKADTVAVFALVRDNDAYGKGKAGTLEFDASLVVESSPGSTHDWIFLPAGISPSEADGIGQGLKALCGGDANTGVITQPYRVAGTPNYPNAEKRKSGRVVVPTRVLKSSGRIWTRERLLAAFPPPAKEARTNGPTGRTGIVDESVEELIAEPGNDRSRRFFDAVKAARTAGMSPDDLEDLMRKHPNGCAAKYLEPDRLHAEIERAWAKLKDRPKVEPTYPAAGGTGVDTARAEVERKIDQFLDAAIARQDPERNIFDFNLAGPLVQAFSADTGLGKTSIAAKCIAKRKKAGKLANPVGFAVPTHRLGEDIANLFRRHSLTAAQWRGRDAYVSGNDGPKMCDDLKSVELAQQAGVPIEMSCCKGKNASGQTVTCPFYEKCAYQKQKRNGLRPDVWIFSHQMLFHAQKMLKDLSVLFIDESFMEAGQSHPKVGVTLDEIEKVSMEKLEVANDLEPYRKKLAQALRASEDGGVACTNLIAAGLTADDCSAAIKLEWMMKDKPKMWPGMSIERRTKAGGNVGPMRAIDRVWRAAHDLLSNFEGDVVSGRLFLMDENTQYGVARVAKTRGIREVAEQYNVPTMIMDATLPDKIILEKWFPHVQVVGFISAPMPFVHVRQVLGAPITKKKILEADTDRSLQAIRRYILAHWIECGRAPTLVICQKEVKENLAEGMPAGIHLEHFNNVAGLDGYKDVRLLITVGRTLPTPFDVEDAAGLLSGVQPIKAPQQAHGGTWFDRVVRGIRLKDGSGVGVNADQHPDVLAEAARWQACEAGLIQAIGRGRGVNRTAATPLDIDILADVVLPIEVDQIEEWSVPGREVEMAAEGVWLESPTDMAAAWPEVWATAKAAERSPESLNRESYKGKWGSVRYQRSGPNQNWKEAFYDPDVIPDPRGWLEDRVGPLAGYEIERRVESEQGTSRPIERLEVDINIPGGRRVTLEHLVVGGETVVGRVAVSCFLNHRALSPDTRPAWAHARF